MQERRLRERAAELEKRLTRFDPDLVDLEIELEKQARRTEFRGHARLVVANRALPARLNRAPSVATLIRLIFEDLEQEAERLVADTRGEAAWKRKRGARNAKAVAGASRRLTEERALLVQAMAGDRPAFDLLAESRLAGVRKEIFDRLSAGGRTPSDDALDAALALTLSRAFERLHEKPERWSVHGWLSWIARQELENAVHS